MFDLILERICEVNNMSRPKTVIDGKHIAYSAPILIDNWAAVVKIKK